MAQQGSLIARLLAAKANLRSTYLKLREKNFETSTNNVNSQIRNGTIESELNRKQCQLDALRKKKKKIFKRQSSSSDGHIGSKRPRI